MDPFGLAQKILESHGLLGPGGVEVSRGMGGTYPTVLVGDHVVKLFAGRDGAMDAYRRECAALSVLTQAGDLPVPRLKAQGTLKGHSTLGGNGEQDVEGTGLPYIVMSRCAGSDWRASPPEPPVRRGVAAALGETLRRIHALAPGGVSPLPHPPAEAITRALAATHVPSRLVPEAPDFVASIAPPETQSFVHGDLMDLHVLIEGGALSGIIDWGDATLADPHYELAKLHLDLFEGDPDLLAVFLEAYGWTPKADFAQRCLAGAILRQAHCVAQHGSCDVFHQVLKPDVEPKGGGSFHALASHLFRL